MRAPIGTFYVDWEGRGYGPDEMRNDVDLMAAEIGDGPVFAGGGEAFMGHFFSSAPAVGEGVERIRGGRRFDGSSYAGAVDVHWTKFASLAEAVRELHLFDDEG